MREGLGLNPEQLADMRYMGTPRWVLLESGQNFERRRLARSQERPAVEIHSKRSAIWNGLKRLPWRNFTLSYAQDGYPPVMVIVAVDVLGESTRGSGHRVERIHGRPPVLETVCPGSELYREAVEVTLSAVESGAKDLVFPPFMEADWTTVDQALRNFPGYTADTLDFATLREDHMHRLEREAEISSNVNRH